MSLKSRISRATIVVAVAIASIITAGIVATPAAADSAQSLYWSSLLRGSASYSSTTHQFAVTDKRSDGYGVKVEYFIAGHVYSCYNNTGYNTTKYCTVPNLGTQLQWRMWLMDGGAEVGGSFTTVYFDVR